MLKNIGYDRDKVLLYAQKWAFLRNPRYMNFDSLGGDCTNFASQCIYAGSGVMNYTKDTGWYYNSPADRSAAWSGVEYLYKFLIGNNANRTGPYAVETEISAAEPGDIVQLGDSSGKFYHSPVVINVSDTIYVAAHTFDSYMRPLYSYFFEKMRCIHIVNCRKWV